MGPQSSQHLIQKLFPTLLCSLWILATNQLKHFTIDVYSSLNIASEEWMILFTLFCFSNHLKLFGLVVTLAFMSYIKTMLRDSGHRFSQRPVASHGIT